MCFGQSAAGYHEGVKNTFLVAASAVVMSAGLGLAGLGTAGAAEAHPAPSPECHWCPGQWWDPGRGNNWDGRRCWFDGDPRDRGHWHGY